MLASFNLNIQETTESLRRLNGELENKAEISNLAATVCAAEVSLSKTWNLSLVSGGAAV